MVLDRLRSFSMFSVHPIPLEEDYHHHPSLELQGEEQPPQPQPAVAEPAIATAPASAPVAAAAASATTESAKEVAEAGEVVHAHQQSSPSTAVVAGAAEATTTAAAERPAATIAESIVRRARACRREVVEEALEGKAALNTRAELFIQQFREDLKLQRLNSIINYTRALRRGAAGMAPAAGV